MDHPGITLYSQTHNKMNTLFPFIPLIAGAILVVILITFIITLRTVVPTNMVHIIQRGSKTISYGVGKVSNVYYNFPTWLPIWGVTVTKLPVSNFGIDLNGYPAYDKDRVPFELDIKGFFHISDTDKAAAKVASYEDLKAQLTNILQGAVRSILAKSKLDEIMEERSVFGTRFTEEVSGDLKSWGVEPVKSVELMDVRDAQGSNVIHQIMAKRISEIGAESRTAVANNNKRAKEAELEAEKEIALKTADTERLSGEAKAASAQAVGIAQANSDKNIGIAEQNAVMEVREAEKTAAEKTMEVNRINVIKNAEIQKEEAIIAAQLSKEQTVLLAEAEQKKVELNALASLEAKKKEAEGIEVLGRSNGISIEVTGKAKAEAEKALQLAGVAAQTELAKEIGQNAEYQNYMVRIRQIEIEGEVNKVQYESLATALSSADLKLLVNSGDVNSGLNKFSDILSSKGGAALNGLIESLKHTAEGAGILSLLDRLKKDDAPTKS